MSKEKIENAVRIKVNPSEITFFDKIFEAYEGLGILSTINGKTGEAFIRVTPDTRDEVLEILRNLPKEVEILDY